MKKFLNNTSRKTPLTPSTKLQSVYAKVARAGGLYTGTSSSGCSSRLLPSLKPPPPPLPLLLWSVLSFWSSFRNGS